MSKDSNSPPSIPKRAYHYYARNGFLGLLREAIPFGIKQLIRHQTIPAKELAENTTKDASIWHLDHEPAITISEPSHQTLKETFRGFPKKFQPERRFVCDFKHSHLVGDNAVGIYRGKNIIPETTGYRFGEMYLGLSRNQLLKYMLVSHRNVSQEATHQDLFPLISPDPSYYHWMLEYLPKLRSLEYYKKITGREPLVVIEPNPRKFVQETLEAAGYSTNQRLEWSPRKLKVDRLIVATHRRHNFCYERPQSSYYIPSKLDFAWLKNRFRLDSKENSENGPKRVYISRQNAERGRKVANYKELSNVLNKFDFKSYELENYSFKQQLQIISDADVIMGPHGAGLLNMIFAEDPTIIELFPDNTIKPHFYYISQICDMDYEAVVFKAVNNNDIHIKTDKLEKTIKDGMI
ncbi:hypothetical protein HTSR_0856 [Halodesulfurarchaeum formicicum]|uniref:Glycosyltransferase 61 catalytic domain-containing protein n=1 Tax=Halodesulfurarchaeum formicicum TaxID=1873524 RepID=A0A1D8S3W1_9EURY|nr:glycosyltransferase family 61 protein [Halodesulfurarchaeum formicicum]AOW80042.1 hypothetical protein HTSR_0856 [Halodesulfurarchaeum formicicum]